jgi:alkylation response protein AidB-like acyl-CoA dehydrogenase
VTADSASLLALADAAEHLTAVRTMADDVLAREWSADRSRDLLDAEAPTWAVGLWHTVAGLGWADILLEAEDGGGTVPDLCVIAESIGASTAPIPFVPVAVGNWCTGRPQTEGTVGIVPVPSPTPATLEAGAKVVVSGSHGFVPYGDVAERMLVHARRPDGTATLLQIATESIGVERSELRPLDAMPSVSLELHDVTASDDEVIAFGDEAVDRWAATMQRLTLGWAAELTGVAAGANALGVDYAKHRVAFDRPIGSFQAIKHRLVDQRAAIEVSRALVARAAVAVESEAADAAALTSLAAFWAVDSLRSVPEGVIQVFGGIGYTWEHVAHVFLRRAAVLAALLGGRGGHRDAVADWLRNR